MIAQAPIFSTMYASPVGELLLKRTEDRLTGLYFQGDMQASLSHRVPLSSIDRTAILADSSGSEFASDEKEPFSEVISQLDEYFAGLRTKFQLKELVLDPEGTAFQRRVWQALLAIPYGETISYGELAKRIGQPTASRAVGLANGRNPISILIPCHRVIGTNGKLVGYGGGLNRKKKLLELEANL